MSNKKLSTQLKGAHGENVAATYLLQNGFEVLHRNWRYRHCEIDLICSKEKVLHFVEVKTRTTKQFGNPEESISAKKMNALKKAAEHYLIEHTEWKNLQFDVVSIILNGENIEEIFFIEDVFF